MIRATISFALLLVLTFTANLSAETPEQWQVLFDGSSLDAWRGYKKDDVPEGWKIDGDTLTRSGRAGDLITKEKYDNYELSFEWKISKGGNSGLIYHVQETKGPSYLTGPEYQVLDNEGTNKEPTDKHAAGALYGLYPPTAAVAKPAGEWNTGRLVSDGSRVEHWLNGKKVVDAEIGSKEWGERIVGTKFAKWAEFAKQTKGHIALQDHGNQVWYRNIKIRPLASPVSAEAKPVRILLVTQSGGFEHSTIRRKGGELSHTEKIMTQLGINSGLFRIDCTKDVAKDFRPELIENFDVVMFYTTGNRVEEGRGLPISEEVMDWFLNTWLKEQGHAFLGVHAATDTMKNYQPYWDMIGGSFDGHPWGAGSTVTLKVHDQNHPASTPFGTSYTLKDEIYKIRNWQPEKVRVLMSLDMETTSKKMPYHVPVLWVKEYGKGRVMYNSLGHREDVWTNPVYQESLLGGIRWLTRQAEGDATPNPELDSAENKLAQQAAK